MKKLNKYGKFIREIREKNNDTLEDLAKKLKLSNASVLSKYELGQRKITPEFLEEVAAVYGVPVSYFYGERRELPEELKKFGSGWVSFIDEMEQKNLTPEQIKDIVEIMNRIKKLDS